MKRKEKTLKRKMERKMKEYMKKDIFNLDVLRQEIVIGYPQISFEKVVEIDGNIRQGEINLQFQFEVTQIFDQGYQH